MKNRSLLIGEQSLLVQCGNALLDQAFSVDAVIARNPIIVDWARDKGIACFVSEREWLATKGEQDSQPFDYLFSITNLRVLSKEILAVPTRMAINFHDGPLPKYAGLNTPVWALLAGEQEYGISWHVMASDVDAGDILKQQFFPVVPGETVFTLNAKCYQAGLDSFTELITELANDTLSRQKQNADDLHVFFKKDRPDSAAVIDWRKSSKEILRLVQALDFGGYANPLCQAKILTTKGPVLFSSVELVDNSGGKPGEIVALTEDSLCIATSDGCLQFLGLTCLQGYPIDSKSLDLEIGVVLSSLESSDSEAINTHFSTVANREGLWIERFQAYQALPAPFISTREQAAGDTSTYARSEDQDLVKVLAQCNEHWRQLNAGDSSGVERLVTALSVIFSRLNREQYASFLSLHIPDVSSLCYTGGLFNGLMPINIDIGEDAPTVSDLENTVTKELAPILSNPGYASDIFARNPELRGQQYRSDLLLQITNTLNLGSVDEAAYRQANAKIVIRVVGSSEQELDLILRSDVASEEVVSLLQVLNELLLQLQSDGSQKISDLTLVSENQWQTIQAWSNGSVLSGMDGESPFIHRQIEMQALQTPDQTAIEFEGNSLSYSVLNEQANQVAQLLLRQGVQPNSRIGVLLERSELMLVTMLGIWKAGCAYVPLDPVYPAQRIQYMAQDAELSALFCEGEIGPAVDDSVLRLSLQDIKQALESGNAENPALDLPENALAYLIYTSGSTGNPKGVMVEHRNVANFFAGMDERLESSPGTWLAVTSISFDISVLELFWTLCRGFKIVLYADEHRQKTSHTALPHAAKDIDFNFFYWNVAEDESEYDEFKYELLIEGAKFADTNGFNAVWTPERHFAAFGGLFPNPSITSAALATITENVELRAGSCVAPLHSPIRMAEEWAVVDNLSNGRVGIAVASGWAPPDFAIKPDSFTDAKQIMFDNAEIARRLWRGETVDLPGPQGDVPVRTLPRPIQPELPIWITTAGNVDSFTKAGEIGANLLTHLLGQTLEDVAEKVTAYRNAWRAAGHEGEGIVTLMLHTFVGPDIAEVEEAVRGPLKRYLKSAMFLVKSAAWNFPTFKKMSDEQGKTLDEFFDTISDEDMDDLLEFAFQRYFYTSGLFGTTESCMEMVDNVKGADIDEIGCLIDFGIETKVVLKHLPYLSQVLGQVKQAVTATGAQSADDYSLAALMAGQDISHLQCTPSMATMLLGDAATRESMSGLKQMMVGGEAFPPDLAAELNNVVGGAVTNMYGPTETTIWSSTADVKSRDTSLPSALIDEDFVSVGTPLCNQSTWIVDEYLQPVPIGVAGELLIGGQGVTRGYHNRADLTDDRFVADPFTDSDLQFNDTQLMYRTGDLARWLPDGRLQCLGRVDHQVKIRGYRVELGEIESLCRNHSRVSEAAVVLREDAPGDQRLVAYLVLVDQSDTEIEQDLKSALNDKLPGFMVPSSYELLDRMPLTPNGKIDRKALPVPKSQVAQARTALDESAVPASDAEQMVADIWRRALGIEKIGKRENFFDIGGHSLLVVQVLKELRESVSKPVQMTDLFRFTTIEALASFISDDQEDGAVVEKAQERAAQRKASQRRRRRR